MRSPFLMPAAKTGVRSCGGRRRAARCGMATELAPWRIKVVRSILGFLGLAVGILLAWANGFYQRTPQERVHAWVQTPCRILQWEVAVSPGSGPGSAYGSSLNIRFEYDFAGKTWSSDRYDEASHRDVDLREFEREGDAARKGAAFCYVNPENPAEASFHPARLWVPWSLAGGGLLLALVSAAFLKRTFFPSRRSRDMGREARVRWWQKAGLLGVAVVSVGLGLLLGFRQGMPDMLWGQFVRGQLVEVSARVEGNAVYTARGIGKRSHQIHYLAGVIYSYEHGGRRWHSDRWRFDTRLMDTGSEERAKQKLADYPAGREVRCWIHPQKPWFATLDPGLQPVALFWLVIPLTFFAGSLWLLRVWWRMRKSEPS